MANFYGTARTNYFRVKDEVAFAAWVASRGYGCYPKDGRWMLDPGNSTDDGWFPTMDDETDEDRLLHDDLQSFLADGEVVVVMEVGAEKLRYVQGHAIAFDNTGRRVDVTLDDIYNLARDKFGVRPSLCEC